jgi:Na+-translocating ferredoxin:NAD+ oxidoreductase RNF subunit RnfB
VSVVQLALSAAILGGVGLAFAVLIAFAHTRFYVFQDPRIDEVVALLPGNNCGACGLPGCRGLAETLVDGKAAPATCTVMNADQREVVAQYLGVEVGQVSTRVARLLCAGGRDVAIQQADYYGIQTCAAAATVAGGGKGCTWGCLSLADCMRACTFGAIEMNDVGLPVVTPEKCTACGDCVEACPKDLFVIMPLEQRLIVQCRNLLEGEAATAVCQVACNACQRCAADAPGVISMRNGLAVVDYDRNDLASPAATTRCPTGAIVWVEGAQFAGASRNLQGVAS